MNEQQYAIAGMTCENCKRHVTEALTGIPGVSAADVDLQGGRATVRSERPLSDREVREALDEAGYELG
jgi:Cu+-exporting ATPase